MRGSTAPRLGWMLALAFLAPAAFADLPPWHPAVWRKHPEVRELAPGAGMVLVTIAPPGNFIDRKLGVSRYERLIVERAVDGARATFARFDLIQASHGSPFLMSLPAGRYRLRAATYEWDADPITDIVHFYTGVDLDPPTHSSLMSLDATFEVRAGQLTDLGWVIVDRPPTTTTPLFANQKPFATAVRGPAHDPTLPPQVLSLHPKLARLFEVAPLGWSCPLAAPESWMAFADRFAASAFTAPRRMPDGRVVIPLEFGHFLVWERDAGAKRIWSGIGTYARDVLPKPDGGFLLSAAGKLYAAPTLEGPWLPFAAPGHSGVGAMDVHEGTVYAIGFGAPTTAGFKPGSAKARPSSLSLYRLDATGAWTELYTKPLDRIVGSYLIGDRLITLVDRVATTHDASGKAIAETKLKYDRLQSTTEGLVRAFDFSDRSGGDSQVSFDRGLTWRSIAGKTVKVQGRRSFVLPLPDGRVAQIGRKQLRNDEPPQLFVGVGKDQKPVGIPLPADCGFFPDLEPIGEAVFVYCEGSPSMIRYDLATGEARGM